ncbi:PASTA domain-containing protein [Bacillus spongiae]|uniref:PASTA domain-containing protein n=1 Tax=Bacillus spongiae TaxID=2683610 RepID=A0ABU8HKD9_9BACI
MIKKLRIPKVFLVLLVAVVLLSTIAVIGIGKIKKENYFDQMENQTAHDFPYIKDTMEAIELDNDLTLFLITDEAGNVNYYLANDHIINYSTESYGDIANINQAEEGINWGGQWNKENENIYFSKGLIANKEIEKVSVNDQTKNIQYHPYRGNTIFYSTEPIEEPVTIKGFSKDNEVVADTYYVTLDDLEIFTRDEISTYAQNKRITINYLEEEFSDTVSKNRVIRHNPAAGAPIEVGGTVDVVLSKGQK